MSQSTITVNGVTIEFNGKLEIRNGRVFADGLDITPEGVESDSAKYSSSTITTQVMRVSNHGTSTVITSGTRIGINIEVNGNVETINVDTCDAITVNNGAVNTINAKYGSIRCGDVLGDIDAKYGSIKCGNVSGSIDAKYGSIKHIKM